MNTQDELNDILHKLAGKETAVRQARAAINRLFDGAVGKNELLPLDVGTTTFSLGELGLVIGQRNGLRAEQRLAWYGKDKQIKAERGL